MQQLALSHCQNRTQYFSIPWPHQSDRDPAPIATLVVASRKSPGHAIVPVSDRRNHRLSLHSSSITGDPLTRWRAADTLSET